MRFSDVIKALLMTALISTAFSAPVSQEEAEAAAAFRLTRDSQVDTWVTSNCITLESNLSGNPIAYVFELVPVGYVITSADNTLPPVIAYSYTNECRINNESRNIFLDIVRTDMEQRLEALDDLSPYQKQMNISLWEEHIAGTLSDQVLEQWPPAGSTPTGGWLEENWTQSAPFNGYCPMDLIAGSRSVAGCPAVAMGMILNFQQTTNATRFNDSDDYYHNYHEYYWIDDDYVAHDFPSWSELNGYLDILDSLYAGHLPLAGSDKAALVYASGAACRQVYTASSSGTFGVTQAFDAYQRFAFADCELLYSTSDSLFERLSDNMINALPAHLAILDSVPQYGHNVVLDGYNTDDFYHINFGWGGSYNGWYQFPLSGMPYNMNIIEGVVIDIGASVQSIENPSPGTPSSPLEIVCLSNPVQSSMQVTLITEYQCDVNISVYSLAGRFVEVVANQEFIAGSHTITWIPENTANGIYLIRASSPLGTDTVKFTVIN